MGINVEVSFPPGGVVPAEQIGVVGHTTVRETLSAWAVDKATGLGFRFHHEAFKKLGFSHRYWKYEKKQEKKYGTTLPFVGVGPCDRFSARTCVPGFGHRVSPMGSGSVGEALLVVPGPRPLRKEQFLNEWSGLAIPEEDDLLDRLQRIMSAKMQEVIDG